ncbi:MAG: D-2-hydroxyacid dehydrogenase [Faecousia sp.]
MKIVVLDGYTENPGDLSWDGLRALGELTVYDRTRPEEAASRIQDAEIIVTNKVPVTRALLEQCPGIRYVSVLATGYNVVDLKATAERGIPVSNVPAYSTAAVGQFTIGMLLEICCQIGFHDRSVHDGDWASCPDFSYWKTPLIELAGKTMGIIGFGRIGRQTGAIAKAMGMRVLATGSRPCDEGNAIAEYVDLDTVLRQSDVISLHCPLFPETTGIINKDSIAKMKDGVIILNMARGPLIVEEDLAQALNSGKVYAAGMDVVSQEPIRADNPLLTAKNCFLTPHIAWASRECRQRIMEITEQNIRSFLDGNVQNRVN